VFYETNRIFLFKIQLVGFHLDLRISALDTLPPSNRNFTDHYLHLLYRRAALMFEACYAVAGALRPAQNFQRRRPPKSETGAARSRHKEEIGDRA